VIAEAAFVTHEMALRQQVDARPQSINDVFIVVDVDAAACAAAGANAGLVLQEPNSLLVEKIFAA